MITAPSGSDRCPGDVCLTVDAEGDSPEIKRPSYLGVKSILPGMLDVFTRFRVKSTFFVQEDEIHAVGSIFASFWRRLQAAGHEIGLHAHGLIGETPERKKTIILGGLDRLRSQGLNVVSFRGGRYHMNRDLIGFLETNGIQIDSSVVPGLREELADGVERCNHIGAPINPYRPSYEDHRVPGGSRILEIPINRYPLESHSWAGILTGREINEEVLFDYFFEIRRDRFIVVDCHSWDGLSPLIRDMLKKKKYALIAPPLRLVGSMIGGKVLNDQGYLIRLEQFIMHVAKQKSARFLTIREAAESIRAGTSP